MLLFMLLCATIICIYKSLAIFSEEKNRPRLRVFAHTYVLPNRADLPPIRIIGYSVSFPGRFTDLYVDDCTGVEPGHLNKVQPGSSSTLYYADESGLKTQTSANLPQISTRMNRNFEILKQVLAKEVDIENLDWSKSPGTYVFDIVIQLPDDFPTALP
jgi:hypothetical protein